MIAPAITAPAATTRRGGGRSFGDPAPAAHDEQDAATTIRKPPPRCDRSGVIDMPSGPFRFRVWTAEEWAALPEAERPMDASRLDDGKTRVQVVRAPMRLGDTLLTFEG